MTFEYPTDPFVPANKPPATSTFRKFPSRSRARLAKTLAASFVFTSRDRKGADGRDTRPTACLRARLVAQCLRAVQGAPSVPRIFSQTVTRAARKNPAFFTRYEER